jgi:hypothetical protein
LRDAGRIAVACEQRAGRTRLATIRFSGLSRSSRSFAEAGGGLRLVFSTLGPGVLAGDRFALTGDVRAGASLVAAGQMATPIFAGHSPSQTDAVWRVEPGATVAVIGEPLVLEPGSTHEVTIAVALAGDGVAVIAETYALRDAACLRMRASARIDGVLAYRDALEVVDAGGAFGSVVLVTASAARRAAFLGAAEMLTIAHAPRVRSGIGETAGAAVIRCWGARVWDVRALALALADRARVVAPAPAAVPA